MDPRVLDAMLPYYTERYGNPHSRTHSYGWQAEEAVEKAREQVAELIGANSKEIIFTSVSSWWFEREGGGIGGEKKEGRRREERESG